MNELDELAAPDLRDRLNQHTRFSDMPDPGPELARPVSPARRVLVIVAALTIFAAAGLFAREAFSSNGGVSVGAAPDPSAVCPIQSHTDPAYVDLAGTEVPKDTLAQQGVTRSQLTLLPATALASFFVDPGLDSAGAPHDGWRPILEEQDRIVIAAPMPDGSWYYANFSKDAGGWKVAGWGATEPVATAAQRGAGLELVWPANTSVDQGSPSADISLVNDRTETWVDDRGEYFATVHLFNPSTGHEIPVGPIGSQGVGREYRVPPGGEVKLPLLFGDLSSVPDGTYQAVACVPQLALASPVGTVTLTAGGHLGTDASPSAVASPDPSGNQQGTTLGSSHVPEQSIKMAVAYLNSMACNVGSLEDVTSTGSTTVGHLAAALPIMAGETGSASWQGLPAATPIYAAVVRGHCQSGGQQSVQGYVLFNDETVLFWRVWNEGLEPHLESPFGPRANAGLTI